MQNEIQNFFDLYKTLSSPNLTPTAKYKTIQTLEKIFLKLNNKHKNAEISIVQKMYVIGKIMEFEIYPILLNIIKYKLNQKICRIKGRAERNRRTHQLIFIGYIWHDFLIDNNLSKYFFDVKYFTDMLQKISETVNVAEEYKIVNGEYDTSPLPTYHGKNKKLIHYYCQIGGTWESYWRGICKNDIRDKRIFRIFTEIEHGNFDVKKIDDDKYIDFNFYCNENRCEKIGAFNNFFKNRCLKLDEIFFHDFLNAHKFEIIDALVHQ